MKKIILIPIIFFSLTLRSYAQFQVDFDYAVFQYSDSLGFLEIYYSFSQPQFKQLTNDELNTEIKGNLHVLIKNAATQTDVVDKDFRFSSIIDSADNNPSKGFAGLLGFLMPFGDYICSLTGSDINVPENKDITTFNISVKPPPEERFSISDIELASSIKESDDSSGMFYKNTFEVIPNPGRVYSDRMPVIYFYSEIYNIDLNPESEKLKIENILYNSNNKEFHRKSKLIPRTNPSIVEVGAINISKAPSGAYNLVVTVTDSLKNLTVYSSKRLFIYNPSVADTQTYSAGDLNILSSEFSSMSEEELNETFGFSRYIASDREQEQWSKLSSEEAKREFLFNFWNIRDKNKATPENEYKRDYFNRVKIANEKYSTIQRKGWRTDRGRILVTYGEPSEIERYPNQVDTKPYEIWQYSELEGGVFFVFADLTGFNDYTLIHSTLRGELRDDTWARKIRT